MVRTRAQIDKLLRNIEERPGIILFTLVDTELANYLVEQCRRNQVPCIPAIESILQQIGKYLNLPAERKIPGWQHATLDESYFKKIEAIDFAMHHDDGQGHEGVNDADIVLVGVSRTSKTPTCLYLAQRGFKAANLPYIAKRQIGIDPNTITKPLVVALTIAPERLKMIRKSRLIALGDHNNHAESYYDDDMIKAELREALRLYTQFNWPVIDVSGKAIEETAAEIMNIFQEKHGG